MTETGRRWSFIAKGDAGTALQPLLSRPEESAIICDIDGTLAPIAPTPEEVEVPGEAREALAMISKRYALVGCVSGRRARDAREIVGLDGIAYVGNHGLELLPAGSNEEVVEPSAESYADVVEQFARDSHSEELAGLGVRLEDKWVIWAFHWRGADTSEPTAERLLRNVADAAVTAGLKPHWGRRVLEIRPPVEMNKGTAVAMMLEQAEVSCALYGGDDTTDLDAFRGLRALQRDGRLRHSVCVGVASTEGPTQLGKSADLMVDGTDGFSSLLGVIAGQTEG